MEYIDRYLIELENEIEKTLQKDLINSAELEQIRDNMYQVKAEVAK
jgi:Tfp pilus assembly protein PilO